MADIKISELTAALTVSDSDVLPMTASGSTIKVSTALLKEHAIGNTDISGIGDGTPTGAIGALDSEDATIKAMIAPTETSPTANSWTTGAQFIWNDVLYNVIADITAGDALTVGTNIAPADTVVEQIEDAVADIAQNASDITTLDASKMSYAANTKLGAHNLLNNGAVTQTLSNVTYTVNTDNTSQLYKSINIYADGTTNTSLSTLSLSPSNSRYKLSDFPSRNLKASIGVGSPILLIIWYYDSGKNYLGNEYSQTAYNSIEMDIPSSAAYFEMAIRVPALTPVNNVRVYPMITTIEDTDSTYAPYTMTNKELTEVGNSFEEVYSDSLISNGTTYGTVKILKNTILPIAFLVWQGNANAIPAGDYDLVSFTGKAYKAISDSIFPVVVFVDGAWDYIRIQPNKAILHIQGVSPTWSTASCMYLTV